MSCHGRVGLPVGRPRLGDDLDVAALDGILEGGHLSVANELGIVIRGCTAEQDVVAFGRPVAQVLRLQLADGVIVVGNVEIDVGFQDQPVVADNGNGALLGGFHDLRRRF